ncbi:MAG: hypothetical protein V1726_02385 [Methanobacteriota archaeon]
MKTLGLLIVIGIFVLITTTGVTAQITPLSHLDGTLQPQTTAFFIGHTTLTGNFPGYPMKSFFNSSAVEDMTAYPLFGKKTISDIDTLYMIDTKNLDIENIQDYTLEQILAFLMLSGTNISRFSHVTLLAEQGSHILGALHGDMTIEADLDYAISGILSLPVTEDITIPFYLIITSSLIETRLTGEQFLILPLLENSRIRIQDTTSGALLQEITNNHTIFFMTDSSLSITEESPIHVYPLFSEQPQEMLTSTITPTAPEYLDIPRFLENISSAEFGFTGTNFSSATQGIPGFETLLFSISAFTNGAMVIIGNNTLSIDQSPQTITNVCFARGTTYTVQVIGAQNPETRVSGEYRLVFLDDHIYNVQAKNSDDGIAFPWVIVLLWVVAVVLFFIFRFFIKREVKQEKDQNIKRYALVFHIAMLILAFILLDREISYQLGISALDTLFLQGFTILLLAFLGLELLIWTLGFFLFALPVQIITRTGMNYLGIGKDGKGFAKGIGDLSIWIFCGLYTYLFMNILLSFIFPGGLFPMG